MDGVIGAGTGPMEKAGAAAGRADARMGLRQELVLRHVVRAARDAEKARLRHQPGHAAGQLPVALEPGRKVLAAADEGRRIGDNEPEPAPLLGQPVDRGERLGLLEVAAIEYTLMLGTFAGECQGRLGPVHAEDMARTGRSRDQTEAAAIAVEVEHVLPVRQSRGEPAVLPLIEIPAGLLPATRVRSEDEAVLLDLMAAGDLALHDLDLGRQALERARRTVVSQDDDTRSQQVVEGAHHLRLESRDAGAVELGHADIAEPIHDQPRQAVALRVSQPIRGPLEQAVTNGERAGKPPFQEGPIDHSLGAAGQKPRSDQRVRVEPGEGHGPSVR